jgi:amino acid transporter
MRTDKFEKSLTEGSNKKNNGVLSKKVQVIVVSSVMLSFISYWRAAAIVLSDLASSAYYSLGIAEKAVGPSAPWFVLFVMLFAYAIRAVYTESSSMFVRGGVYRVVHEALGETLAKFSVSALIFDYLITSPISAVAAGLYIVGLLNSLHLNPGTFLGVSNNIIAMIFALIIEIYFWQKNIIGIEESSQKAMRVFQITSILAILLFIWSVITLFTNGFHIPPFSIHLSEDSLGVLKHVDWVKTIAGIGVLVGMGHAVLAVSGEETLAQVYREVEAPKLKNFLRAGLIIFIFSFMFTGINSLFASLIVPQNELVGKYNDNALSGLAMHQIGPQWLLLLLQGFVVFVGFVVLSGAVNTAFIGANSVLNRVAEDGVLHEWFRKPHKKYGTTYRIINLLAILQIIIIVASRGDVFLIGEAYAFGVVWSFIMKAFSMIVLRYKDKTKREWRVGLNFKIGKKEIPAGLCLIFFVLLSLGIINLFTKPFATVGGISFTIILYFIFGISERANRKLVLNRNPSLEKFNVNMHDSLATVKNGSTNINRKLVAVSAPDRLFHLQNCLHDAGNEGEDIIVMKAKKLTGIENMLVDNYIGLNEEELFTKVIQIAEKEGKTVRPIVIPTNNVSYAIAETAYELNAKEVYIGISEKYPPEYQLEQFALFWGRTQPDENKQITVKAIGYKNNNKFELSYEL